MKVLELPVARSTNRDLRPPPHPGTPVSLSRLAPALTGAAAVAGVVEVVLERVTGPMLTHVAGASLAPVATLVSRLGALTVAVTAVLVVLAAAAWAGAVWDRYRIVAATILAAVVLTLAAGFYGDPHILPFLHISVAAAAMGTALVVRGTGVHRGAVAAVAVAIVAGQWSLAGWSGPFTVTARVVAEAALVLAILLLAGSLVGAAGRRAMVGLMVGAMVAAAALMSDRTPLIALWASGATLWMPSIVYIGAGAAVGLILATWLPDRSTRHLAAGLTLLAVAGIEPALLHHNLTALVALLALSAEGSVRWR